MKKQKLEKISDNLFNELTSRQVRLVSGGGDMPTLVPVFCGPVEDFWVED